MEENTKNEVALRPPSSTEKVTPRTRRILTLMAMETLELAQNTALSGKESPHLPQEAVEDAESFFQTGERYFNGTGLAQDYAEAVKWYRRAAEKGHADAENNLGNCYYYGKGVPQDYTEAVKWYRKAADHGNADAEVNLRVLLLFRARRPGKQR